MSISEQAGRIIIDAMAGAIVNDLAREKAREGIDAAEAFLWATHSPQEIADIYASKLAYAQEYAVRCG